MDARIEQAIREVIQKECAERERELKQVIQDLVVALRHAQTRLNSIPHKYEQTDFALIREALKKGKGYEPYNSDPEEPGLDTTEVQQSTEIRVPVSER